MSFIRNCERALTKQPTENNFNGFVVLLYVQGVSEKIGGILKQIVLFILITLVEKEDILVDFSRFSVNFQIRRIRVTVAHLGVVKGIFRVGL